MTIYNFSSGPAMLPRPVMEQIHAEWFNWNNTGLSAVEWSHRDPRFEPMIHETKSLLAELLQVPPTHEVLLLQGGASLLWSILPMNVAWGQKIGFVNTGVWSEKAYNEGKKYGTAVVVGSSADGAGKFTDIAPDSAWNASHDLAYIHYCSNETIQGIQYHTSPKADLPLVCDVSSDILSQPMPIDRYGAIYAGAQKNMGVAGLTVLIIRKDWINITHDKSSLIPSTLSFAKNLENQSLLNTPCTFAIYVANLVCKWVKSEGGVLAMQKQATDKAHLLYSYLDGSDFYQTSIAPRARSYMNVTFSLKNENHQAEFLKSADGAGLKQLKGHRLQGGLRASIYNAMPRLGVEALIHFMDDFAKKHS